MNFIPPIHKGVWEGREGKKREALQECRRHAQFFSLSRRRRQRWVWVLMPRACVVIAAPLLRDAYSHILFFHPQQRKYTPTVILLASWQQSEGEREREREVSSLISDLSSAPAPPLQKSISKHHGKGEKSHFPFFVTNFVFFFEKCSQGRDCFQKVKKKETKPRSALKRHAKPPTPLKASGNFPCTQDPPGKRPDTLFLLFPFYPIHCWAASALVTA